MTTERELREQEENSKQTITPYNHKTTKWVAFVIWGLIIGLSLYAFLG